MNALWSKLESNLASLRVAGAKEVGEILPVESYGGGAPREEQLQKYREEERVRLQATAWKRR